MGLYLGVFASATDDDDEIDGVEVGSYDDFHALRSTVAERLESDRWASRFPVLMSHSDSDGEWSPSEAGDLTIELATIEEELSLLPARDFSEESWQAGVAKLTGLAPRSLADSFIDVDGEPLLRRLRGLADIAAARACPISFQ